ncbi:MAG: glutamate dehydrogenase, partial [Gammaproteobacteria bacterium]
EDMFKHAKKTVDGNVAVVSGSGNVAQFTVEKLLHMGVKVVTMSDSSGYVYDTDGINTEKLEFIKHLKNVERGRISTYAEVFGAQYFENERPWNVSCQMAFPCATQNEINKAEAELLVKNGCIAVVEGSNMPSEWDAIDVFQDAKIMFVPSKAANAGGVAVSGLELTQNSMRLSWTREETDQKLRKIMSDIHDRCVEYGQDSDDYVNYLKGANIAGFIKVANAMIAYGIM